MYFLIDYENTGSSGLRGVKYLGQEDIVAFFYSTSCSRIEAGILCELMDSGCRTELCCLERPGKNALDFYITSWIGEICREYDGMIAIVSRDKGFRAVQAYWKNKARIRRNIVLSDTIEQCIRSANEPDFRTKQIQRELKLVSLTEELTKYMQERELRERLKDMFGDSEYGEKLEEIRQIFGNEKNKKAIYLNSLKKFGRKRGLEIYGKAKEILEE